jgi:hypothetical protein
VLEAMVSNMVHVIDALARHGVLQFAGQGSTLSNSISAGNLSVKFSSSNFGQSSNPKTTVLWTIILGVKVFQNLVR